MFSLLLAVAALSRDCLALVYPCSSEIYCRGRLLQTVQKAGLWNDSKTFVDMSLQVNPEEAMRKFLDLGSTPSKEQVWGFVNQSFFPPGEEFEPWEPPDYVPRPAWLEKVKDADLREFGQSLCAIWKDLGRKIRVDVRDNPERYSLLYSPNPFIVPGGRFREFYYWDTYWVVLGLLRCQMTNTVKGMLENFFLQIQALGFVPNGGRRYYEGRSQPPLLAAMLEAYFRSTGDRAFLKKHLPLLEAELRFWVTNRSLEVTVNGTSHQVARYATRTNTPRPESYIEDMASTAGFSQEKSRETYIHLTSAAESGWDFSSRWFSEESGGQVDLGSIRTTDIVPVDLNSILCMNERLLAEFFNLTGDCRKWRHYQAAFQRRRLAVRAVFWEEEAGVWLDWHLPSARRRSRFFPSGLWPLTAACAHSDISGDRVLDFLQRGWWLSFPGGVPTSLRTSGQQWDFPNAWPPLQHVTVSALRHAGTSRTRRAAQRLAQSWTTANWKGFRRTGHMFEKYDVEEAGRRGGGGEYGVQLGFGWSNGVVLDFLYQYGNSMTV